MLTLQSTGRYFLMIVGIDQYPDSLPSLHGCVHDAESLVRLLLRAGLAPQALQGALFLAPRAGQASPWAFAEPTKRNLLARLADIAAAVTPADHVLLFYAGHGTQRTPVGTLSSVVVEALVPVDLGGPGADLLYDFELARYLDELARVTESVTVILDCCHAAGSSRSQPSATARQRSRSLELTAAQLAALPTLSPPAADLAHRRSETRDDPRMTIIAACHAHEKAQETEAGGQPRGVFSAVLFDLLQTLLGPTTEQPPSPDGTPPLRWMDIWPELLAGIEALNPEQHPSLSGPSSRPILGGQARPCDPGLPIVAQAKSYAIAAGQLLGLSPGAQLGVYGPYPDRFPALHSVADRDQRLLTVQIDSADLVTATASPLSGPVQSLPRGARARLLRLPLSLSLSQPLRPEGQASPPLPFAPAEILTLAEQQGLQLVLCDTPDSAELQAVLSDDGSLLLGDRQNPPQPAAGRAPMALIPGGLERKQQLAALIAASLHYAKYALPLRLAALASSSLAGRQLLPAAGLEVDLLDCSGRSEAQCQDLVSGRARREAMAAASPGRYALRPRSEQDVDGSQATRFALWFRNRAKVLLFVSAFLCGRDGQVEELLLDEQVPPGAAGKLAWAPQRLGEPIELWLPPGLHSGCDRLVVIACTVPGPHGLQTLRQEQSLQGVVDAALLPAAVEAWRGQAPAAARLPKPYTAWTARELKLDLSLAFGPDLPQSG